MKWEAWKIGAILGVIWGLLIRPFVFWKPFFGALIVALLFQFLYALATQKKKWQIGLLIGLVLPTLFLYFTFQSMSGGTSRDDGWVGVGIMIVGGILYAVLIPSGVILGYLLDKKLYYSSIGATWGIFSIMYFLRYANTNYITTGIIPKLGYTLFFPSQVFEIIPVGGGTTAFMIILLDSVLAILIGAGVGYIFDRRRQRK